MNSESVIKSIKKILITSFPWLNDGDQILLRHRLREDLELDSLAMVKLQIAVEDEFDIHFDPIQMDLTDVFETVGSLGSFVESQLINENKKSDF